MSAIENRRGHDPQELANFAASLDETVQSANGYGELTEAVIIADLQGGRVTARYQHGEWNVHFEVSLP